MLFFVLLFVVTVSRPGGIPIYMYRMLDGVARTPRGLEGLLAAVTPEQSKERERESESEKERKGRGCQLRGGEPTL